ncbi:hypothetical protein HRI_003452200 [Hibiscus trionum]|uniref:F-box associated beta-propeller type 3 domain-containing protein n=1 Tax=Hibiscus trionum TaxID=183268 RepID=A0A9W7IJJ0_HIBTR|nr:hypothetical protein HRI_003452200 [Hibiscus trionum]
MATRDFNWDLLFEILSRADLETLRKCRILSRECNALTYKSTFLRSHCERTNTLCGYLIHSMQQGRPDSTFLSIHNPGVNPKSISFDFLPARRVRILAGADIGLFFCQSHEPQTTNYYICKPTTLQWELVPKHDFCNLNRSKYYSYFVMVLTSNPLRFKILRLHTHIDLRTLCCAIFYSDIWGWKQLDDFNIPDPERLFLFMDATSACGRLHWVTNILGKDKYRMLSFDQDKESWESISVPDACSNLLVYRIILAVYQGKLAIMGHIRDTATVEVWVMRNNSEYKWWEKIFTFNQDCLRKQQPTATLVSFCDAHTVLVWECSRGEYSRAVFYNFNNGQSTIHNLNNFKSYPFNMFSRYLESVYFLHADYEPVQFK